MKFTVLIDNSAVENFKNEHGLSILIEYNKEPFLLDAGSTDLFLENARLLDVPLWDVKTCFLSHGHYDHSGGFGTYLTENKDAVLYMMKSAVGEFFSNTGEPHPIGIPAEVIQKHSHRFQLIDDVLKVKENVYLIPHHTEGLEQIGERAKLYRKLGNGWMPDDFSHEMSLVFDTEKGLVIFNSCSHGGAQTILREVMDILPDKSLYAFIGGLHMKGKKDGEEISIFSETEIQDLAEELKQLGLQYLYTGHCTGRPAMELLKKYMGEQVRELYSGLTVEL